MDDGVVQEIPVADLLATTPFPYLRWDLADDPLSHAWVHDRALVLEVARSRRGSCLVPGRTWVALGPRGDLDKLLATLADAQPAPDRLSIEDVGARVPWPHQVAGHWTWMWSDLAPPSPDASVVEVGDAAEIDALLDAGNPTAWSRPGWP